jgi:subtilisin family serine protease
MTFRPRTDFRGISPMGKGYFPFGTLENPPLRKSVITSFFFANKSTFLDAMKKPEIGRGHDINLSDNEAYYGLGYADEGRPLYTGRYLVTLGRDRINSDELFGTRMGMRVAHSRDFSREMHEADIADADAFVFDELGIALVSGDAGQIKKLSDEAVDYLIEPEKVVYLPEDVSVSAAVPMAWGIGAIEASESPFTGKGIKVAVLDTGMATDHPDFQDRRMNTESFVPDEKVDDQNGHGTHCIGTACGRLDDQGRRYGVATEAEIHAGKVLSNAGTGAQFWVLSAIVWALKAGCHVISMSLGSPVYPGQGFDPAYERAGKYALENGSIMVAAAGNESRRSSGVIRPVGSPANCPSILAVGAVDANLGIGDFSNRSINPGGQVDVVGPGVDVYSSWPMPGRYKSISGTSMATPHVAGILAMLWEKHPGESGYFILNELKNRARRLDLPSIDVGVGLALAPQIDVV